MELLLNDRAVRALAQALLDHLGDQHLALQQLANAFLHKSVQLRLLAESHLKLGRMHVHIDQRRMHFQLNDRQRKAIDWQKRVVRPQYRLVQSLIANVPAVHDRRHTAAIGTGKIRPSNKAGNFIVQIICGNRHHRF
ncbi:hypothetical protein D3C77_487260 [compost metagenome]